MEKLKIRPSRAIAPSLFTIGNMACGFYSLLASSREEFTRAAAAILAGMAFDSLDGRVARLVRGVSAFGIEFDSLSDFLSFGLAPASMMHSFILKDYGSWGSLVAFFFTLCAALRLARFNVSAHGNISSSKGSFSGLPTPAAAGFLASFVLVYQIIEEGRPARTWEFMMRQVPALYGAIPFLILGLALLMVSKFPYPSFKGAGAFRLRSTKTLLIGILTTAFLLVYPQNTIFAVFSAYALSGPIVSVLRRAKNLLGKAGTAPPRSTSSEGRAAGPSG